MKRLWLAAAMAPLMYAAAAHAAGPTTISTTTTTPVATSATGALTISNAGSISPTTAGTPASPIAAVTIDSNTSADNTVTNNGVIGSSTGLSNTIGILGLGGKTGVITNAGSITLTEDTSKYQDTNKDGIIDSNGTAIGQITAYQNRYGIELSGAGAFTGSLVNTGTVSVSGDQSAGIFINTPLIGNLTSSGSISVTGGDYYDLNAPATLGTSTSYAIHAAAPITGNVSLSGTIAATGRNATGVALDQGVTGQVEIFGGQVSATGFRSVSAPTDTALLAILNNGTPTSRSELMLGGPAVHISGGVSAGISIDAGVAAVPASGSTPAVAAVAAGALTSYGSAPALQIDGAGSIGQYKTSGYSIIIGGKVDGAGTYALDSLNAPISATGMLIGGSTVVTKGIDVTGSISAASLSLGSSGTADATAIHLANTATTSKIDVAYGAAVGASAQATNSPNVTAIKIDSTASLGALVNNGVIQAFIGGYNNSTNGVPNAASGGVSGYATAVSDLHGGLTSIMNRDVIAAAFSPGVSGATVVGSAVALDLRAAAAPMTITQETITVSDPTFAAAVAAYVAAGSTLTAPVPSITGDLLLGSGGTSLNVKAGTVTGAISFGNGVNALNIGTTLSAAPANAIVVKGALVNTGALSVDVNYGTLQLTNSSGVAIGRTVDKPGGITGAALTGPVNLTGLHVGSSGSLIFTANSVSGVYDQFNVSGTATLDPSAQIGIALTGKVSSPQSYKVISAGTLNATVVSQALLGSIPYLYTGVINTVTGANGSVSIAIAPRTAAQAGLNPAETSAFNAVFANFDKEAATSSALLGKTTKSDFTRLYDQFLPDYAGGPFETLMVGQQALSRAEAEGPLKLRSDESRGWVQEISYVNDRHSSSKVNGYNGAGFGAAAGFEVANDDGAVGVAGAFMTNAVHNGVQVPDATLNASVVEGGVYWRSSGPGLNASANLNAGWGFFDSRRLVVDQTSNSAAATLIRTARSNWSGGLVSAQIALNYPITMGRFYLRPEFAADYTVLYEGAHSETGGGTAVNLSIAAKTNQEATVQGDVVMGATFGDSVKWRPELTLGWREIVAGGPASTSAHFASGGTFVLSPQFTEKGGLLARLGLRAGGAFADFSADAGGVFRGGYDTYDARAMARFLF